MLSSADVMETTALAALLRDRVERGQAIGLAAGVVSVAGGRVHACFGSAGPGDTVVSDETVFDIGSVTKLFTSTLLADRIVHGRIDLDAPVQTFLPAGVRVPARGREITIADVATHTSGLPRLPTNLDPLQPAAFPEYSVHALYAFLSSYELPRDVGSQYEYSNTGYLLLGHILELCEKTRLADLVADRLVAPLGMTSTGYGVAHGSNRRSVPHDERLRPLQPLPPPDNGGAGGLLSTLSDMLRFAAAAIRADGPLAPAFALAKTPRFAIAEDRAVGLGWHTRRPVDHEVAWHSGETPGTRAALVADDKTGMAAVVLSNCALPVEDLVFHIADRRAPLSAPQPTPAVHLSDTELEHYIGEYDLDGGGIVSITRDADGLVGAATGIGSAPLVPRSTTQFFVQVIPVTIDFDLDSRGDAVSLTLHAPGPASNGLRARRRR